MSRRHSQPTMRSAVSMASDDLPNVKLKPKPGTIAAVIAELEKLQDRSMPLYFDCPECGKGHIFKTVSYSAVIETERKA